MKTRTRIAVALLPLMLIVATLTACSPPVVGVSQESGQFLARAASSGPFEVAVLVVGESSTLGGVTTIKTAVVTGTLGLSGTLTIASDGGLILDEDGDLHLTICGSDVCYRNATEDQDMFFQVNDGGGSVTLLALYGSESRVGVNTTVPSERLHVEGGNILVRSGDVMVNSGEVQINQLDGTNYGNLSAVAANVVALGTSGGDDLVVDKANHRVGANVAAPRTTLDVGGLISVIADADTIATTGDGNPATHTLTPTTSYVELTCNDADTCDVTMGETGMVEGTRVVIVNVSANVCDFADAAGVSELAGAFAMGQYDVLTLQYIGDTWVEVSRSDN